VFEDLAHVILLVLLRHRKRRSYKLRLNDDHPSKRPGNDVGNFTVPVERI